MKLSTVAAVATSGRVLGSNDRVNLAIAGLGGRGTDHMESYAALPGVRIAALCDVDQAARERGVALVKRLTGSEPKTYADLRELLAEKEIDAVSLATPNHWHALQTIWACRAGKDVYVEKPASHNIHEAVCMVQAARKYNRMVQVGTQSRSDATIRGAMEFLRSGGIGQIHLAKGLCFKRRRSIGRKPDGPVPPGLNWDEFLGPAPMRAFNENRFHYNWHWFWDTGNGDIGNQGVHQMDIARWGAGLDSWPAYAVSTGGKFLYDDDQETPNMQFATLGYSQAQIMFEVRGLITPGEGGMHEGANTVGNIFYGSEGFLVLDDGYRVFKGEKRQLVKEVRPPENDTMNAAHMGNFLAAVRSRKASDLNADIAIGAMSANLCHLANISYRVGRELNLDPAGAFKADPQATALRTRPYRAPWTLPDPI
ncbi:Gfo/Idh/MocA family oxidoreductase [uncultured Paludibaculum sp.]|uniref:Gfo/Idh/MocA family protein n=1 Tax=uncultured Paludibaculum sp. TaxID=1765020 RepID=UPI002AAA7AAD|nr:Gfo/Idh/MocA family oxidoreductase [uncultured Paludibaculum sp.]